jgi:hypothetical protein
MAEQNFLLGAEQKEAERSGAVAGPKRLAHAGGEGARPRDHGAELERGRACGCGTAGQSRCKND